LGLARTGVGRDGGEWEGNWSGALNWELVDRMALNWERGSMWPGPKWRELGWVAIGFLAMVLLGLVYREIR
jgi:hypothetical protein